MIDPAFLLLQSLFWGELGRVVVQTCIQTFSASLRNSRISFPSLGWLSCVWTSFCTGDSFQCTRSQTTRSPYLLVSHTCVSLLAGELSLPKTETKKYFTVIMIWGDHEMAHSSLHKRRNAHVCIRRPWFVWVNESNLGEDVTDIRKSSLSSLSPKTPTCLSPTKSTVLG